MGRRTSLIRGVAGALCAAANGIGDYQRRVRGSPVGWSCDWNRSGPDELRDHVAKFPES